MARMALLCAYMPEHLSRERTSTYIYAQGVLRVTSSCKFSSSEAAVCLTLARLSHLGLPPFPFVFLLSRGIRCSRSQRQISANKQVIRQIGQRNAQLARDSLCNACLDPLACIIHKSCCYGELMLSSSMLPLSLFSPIFFFLLAASEDTGSSKLSTTLPSTPTELSQFPKLCELRRKFPVLYRVEFQVSFLRNPVSTHLTLFTSWRCRARFPASIVFTTASRASMSVRSRKCYASPSGEEIFYSVRSSSLIAFLSCTIILWCHFNQRQIAILVLIAE